MSDAPDDQAGMRQTAKHSFPEGEWVTSAMLNSTGRGYLLGLPGHEFWDTHVHVEEVPPGMMPPIRWRDASNGAA
jgi:hypothetical protein